MSLFIHNISSKHDRETTDCKIFRNTSHGLLTILELKVKCCLVHFLINYLPFNIFAVCRSFSITRSLNKAEAAYE